MSKELSIAELDSVALRPRGGKPRAISLPPTFSRALNEADLPAIAAGKPKSEPHTIVLSEVRAKHHTMAMMLAAGAALARVSFVTGYSVETIKKISKSPLFTDLLSYYTEQKEHEFKDFYAKAAQVGMDAIELLHQRMMDNPDDLKTRELLEIANTLLEKTILPNKPAPQSSAPAAPQPVTVIQFIDSPHAGAPVPPAGGGQTIEVRARELPSR